MTFGHSVLKTLSTESNFRFLFTSNKWHNRRLLSSLQDQAGLVSFIFLFPDELCNAVLHYAYDPGNGTISQAVSITTLVHIYASWRTPANCIHGLFWILPRCHHSAAMPDKWFVYHPSRCCCSVIIKSSFTSNFSLQLEVWRHTDRHNAWIKSHISLSNGVWYVLYIVTFNSSH